MSFSNKTPSDLKVAGTKELASFSESVRKSRWKGNGIHILLACLYAKNYPYPQAKVEVPHETLFLNSKDMMWKLVIKFACTKKNKKFKIKFPGGEKEYFDYIRNAIEKHRRKLASNKKKSMRNYNSQSHSSSNISQGSSSKNSSSKSSSSKSISSKSISSKSSSSKNNSKNIVNKLTRKKKKRPIKLFIMSGVFMGDESGNPNIGHYNIIIYDTLNNIIERIEPYGYAYSSFKTEKNFDKKLEEKFRNHGFPVTIIPPSKYMSRKSFQWIEENRELKKGIGEVHKSDAGGYCGVYATWMAHERFMYPYYKTEKLFRKMQDKVIGKVKIHNYIRNLAEHYVKSGNRILEGIHMKSPHSKKLEYLAEQALATSISN